jgi:hypothetical protein
MKFNQERKTKTMTDQEINEALAKIKVNADKLQTQIDDLASGVEQERDAIKPDAIEDEDEQETVEFRKGALGDLHDNLDEASSALDDMNLNYET